MIRPQLAAISEIFTKIIIWKPEERAQIPSNRFATLEASKHCFSEINQTSNVARDDRQDVVWFVYILICPEGSLGPQQKPKLIKQIFILDCFVVMELYFITKYLSDKVSQALTL